jgi:hypothetical protein
MVYLKVNKSDLIERQLWYHKRGLQQTASGYGSKLTTHYMIKLNNRLYRVYCMIYSNSGTLYIISKGVRYILDIDESK